MARVAPAGSKYNVPARVVVQTLEHLRSFRTEAVCFWLGDLECGVAQVSSLWIPKFTATLVSYDIEPTDMLRLKQHLDESALCLFAQIHSHPGSAFHSERDDLNAASPWPGFISIVVPDLGRSCEGFWDSVEMYELVGGASWKHLGVKEKKARFLSE